MKIVKTIKNKEKLIRDKIAIWSKHQELDKFNYNDAAVKLFGSLAILVALITILFSSIPIFVSKEEAFLWSSLLLVLAVILYFRYSYLMKVANAHFIIRENMIYNWYHDLGVDKKELNKEFTKLYKKPYILF